MKALPVHDLMVDCDHCVQLSECGGLVGLDRYEGCFAACRERGCRSGKGWTCPCQQAEFVHRMRVAGGMGPFLPPTISPFLGELPRFIPTIDHNYRRTGALEYPAVALPLRFVLPYLRAGFTAADLREGFGLAQGTRLLLLGIARDIYLERYWCNRVNANWPTRIAELGFIAATSPNYSFFRDAPRTDIVFNRRRILITSGELSTAGVPTVLHLNALTPFDWDYWADILRQQSSIVYIVKEFQTGLRHVEEGKRAIYELARLQDRVGRELRPIVVGGTQYLELTARHFNCPAFVESSPFMRTIYRRSAMLNDSTIRWTPVLTADDELLDDLLAHNIAVTERSILRRWEKSKDHAKSFSTTRRRITPNNPQISASADRGLFLV